MNVTLLRAFLLQRFTSLMRLGITSLFTFFPFLAVMLGGSLEPLAWSAGPLALVFAAGAIGQDVSSGTLQLVLVRPVTRPTYVVHRWLGAMLATSSVMLALVGVGVLGLFLRGTPPEALAVVRLVLDSLTTIAGYTAVLLMLSSFIGGVGDLALYAATLFVMQMLAGLAQLNGWREVLRATAEIQGVLMPNLSWAWLGTGMAPSWFGVVSWASTIVLSLAVAIFVVNRKELSYASG